MREVGKGQELAVDGEGTLGRQVDGHMGIWAPEVSPGGVEVE